MTIQAATVFDRTATATRIGGYMDTEWVSQGTVNTFKAHRFILQTGAQINQAIRFNSEIEFEYGGFVTNDETTSQKGEIKVEQAWVDYDASDRLTIRTGIVLIPVGQLNIYHDSDMREFTDRPLVNKYIIPTTWMDTGIGGYGTLDIGDAELTYEGYITNGLTSGATYSTETGARELRPNFKTDDNQGKAISGRVGYSPNLNQVIGFSAYRGQNSQQIIAIDGQVSYGTIGIKGEAAQYTDGFDHDGFGYTLESAYNIAPLFQIHGEWNLLARYEYVDTVNTDADTGRSTRTAVGMNYRPHPQLVYKIAYHFNEAQTDDADDAIFASVAIGF